MDYKTRFNKLVAIGIVLLFISVCGVWALTRTITDTGDTVDTYIKNSNGNYYDATEAGLRSAIFDGNTTNSKVSLPAGGRITVSTAIPVLWNKDYSMIIEGNGCNLVKGSSNEIFNFSGWTASPTRLVNEKITISNVNFDCNQKAGYALKIQQKKFVTLYNLNFTNSLNTTAGNGAYLLMGSRSYYSDIINCNFLKGYAGIKFNDTLSLGYGSSNAGIVDSCNFNELSNFAIENDDAGSLRITSACVENSGNGTTHIAAVIIKKASNVNIRYSENTEEALINITSTGMRTVVENSCGLLINSDVAGAVGIKIYANDVTIRNNVFKPVGRTCIRIYDGDNIKISGNIVSDVSGTITMFVVVQDEPINRLQINDNYVPESSSRCLDLYDISNSSISHNSFYNMSISATNGIILAKTTYGCKNVTITDNFFSLASGATRCLYVKNVGTSHIIISHNTFYASAAGQDAILLENVNNILIIENNFANVADEKVSIGTGCSKYIIRDNIGYITENWGNAKITATTYVRVTHGLATTPTCVFIQQNSTAAAGINRIFIVNASTSTTFDVKINVTGTCWFNWYAKIYLGTVS